MSGRRAKGFSLGMLYRLRRKSTKPVIFSPRVYAYVCMRAVTTTRNFSFSFLFSFSIGGVGGMGFSLFFAFLFVMGLL